MPSIRFCVEELAKTEVHDETLWNQFLKLIHTTDTLVSEGLIEDSTGSILHQIAYDFKVAIQALQETREEKLNRQESKTQEVIDPKNILVIGAPRTGKTKLLKGMVLKSSVSTYWFDSLEPLLKEWNFDKDPDSAEVYILDDEKILENPEAPIFLSSALSTGKARNRYLWVAMSLCGASGIPGFKNLKRMFDEVIELD